MKNYWCCCGTQIGIGWGPGLTRELARWMVHGAADISMRDYDPRRFGSYATKEWQVVKAKEDYCLRHEIPFPHFNRLDGRPVKPSPLHDLLKSKGAVHEEVYGHERPRWFARGDVAQKDHYSFRKTVVDDMVAHEVAAVRDSVGIMDISAFTKIAVSGPDAAKLLDRLTANRLPQKIGGIGLTHMLNERGRIELETTIVKLDDDHYYLVCAAFFEQRLLDHIARHQGDATITVECLSESWCALAINGPNSRKVMAKVTDSALDNASFKWLSGQKITIAGHELWALRLSYAGELGYELHLPRDAMMAVYQALWDAGQAHDICDYGSFAMNAMRMEKGFKGAGELTNEVTLPEADVMRFVKMDKDFIGKDKTEISLSEDQKWVCAYLEIAQHGDSFGHGGEAVYLNGEVVGSTASVAYGPSVDKILAFAYVKPEAAADGTELEVVVHGEKRSAKILGAPAYDPQSELPRAAE